MNVDTIMSDVATLCLDWPGFSAPYSPPPPTISRWPTMSRKANLKPKLEKEKKKELKPIGL